MVDLGQTGAAVAAGEPAGTVAGFDEGAQGIGHSVGGASTVEQVAGEGVADQAPHGGAGIVVNELADHLGGHRHRSARPAATDGAGLLG